MPLPSDLHFENLPIGPLHSWKQRWDALVTYLAGLSPCIYLPNYDYAYSVVCPALPESVAVVGVVHSDDPVHYDHLARLGRSWNAVVAVSRAVAETVAGQQPEVVPRMRVIPYGLPCPELLSRRIRATGSPIRVVYAGRLVQLQKRVLDVAAVAHRMHVKGIPFEIRIAGDGPDREALERACGDLLANGSVRFLGTLSNDDVVRELDNADAFLLTSDFEGLPLSLLEAMSRGAVPVVSDIRSGIPEAIAHDESGFRVPVGDIEGFASCLALLQANPNRQAAMAEEAHRTVASRYRLDVMVDAFESLFEQVWRDVDSGSFRRAPGPVRPLEEMPRAWREHFPPLEGFLPGPAGRLLRRLAAKRKAATGRLG